MNSDRPYTTQELVKILEAEHLACIKGQRLDLNATVSGNPLVDRIINPEGVQRFSAYQGFRRTVHDYQQRAQISGLVWQTASLHQKQLTFPRLHDHLIALPQDIQKLQDYLQTVYQFWCDITAHMELHLEHAQGRHYQPIDPVEVQFLMREKQWATLKKHERDNFLEIVLQVGWGDPVLAKDRRGLPISGQDYVHAVRPGCQPIA